MTLIRIAEIIHERLGWCPNAGALRTAPAADSGSLQQSSHDIPQPGGSAGSGRGDRGLQLFLGSLRAFRENGGLAWYSVLACVWAVLTLAQIVSLQISSIGIPAFPGWILPSPGTIAWLLLVLSLTLIVEYTGVVLSIGIMYSINAASSGRQMNFSESLVHAAQRTSRVNGYILILTVAGILPPAIRAFFPGSFPAVVLSGVVDIAGLAFVIGTLFVIPILAFEEEGLGAAMRRSVLWMRQLWAEAVFGAFLYILVFVLITAVFVIVLSIPLAVNGPPFTAPTGPEIWLLFTAMMVVSVAVLIPAGTVFLFGLYVYARKGALPVMFDPMREAGPVRTPGRFSRGFVLAKESVGLIRQNTAILVFSILTGVMVWLNMIAMHLTNLVVGSSTGASAVSAMIAKGSFSGFIIIFAVDFAGSMLTTFVVAGLFTVVSLTIAGRIPTVREGLEHARLHLRPIIAWVFLITTVQITESVALAVFTGTVQQIGGAIILLSIYTMTLFVVPVFLFEEKGLSRAIVSSAGIVRGYWREIAGGIATVVVAFFILGMIGLVPAYIITNGAAEPGLPSEILLDIIFAAVMIVSEILIVCLYLYATGRMPGSDEGRPYPAEPAA